MKIAIVSPYITSYHVSEKYYNSQQINLARELAKMGNEVEIFTVNCANSIKKKILKNGKYSFKINYLPIFFKFDQQIIIQNLISELHKEKFDIILSSEHFSFTTLHLCLFKKKLKSKIVLFQGAYDYSNKFFWRFFQKIYDYVFSSFVSSKVDFSIAKTTSAQSFLKNLGFDKIKIIPIGVDTNRFKPLAKKTGKFNILYLGIIEKRRNVDLIIKVINRLIKSNYDVKLTLIGDGPERNKVRELIKRFRLERHVIYKPKITNNQTPTYFSNADVFILPSSYEIFGIVLLESLSCGTPVISTPTAGALDIIKDGKNGYIVPFDDEERIYRKIRYLIDNEEKLKGMSELSRDLVIQEYDWKDIVSKYQDYFREIKDARKK